MRKRLTKAEQATLDAQIVEVLKADNPQSVRHVFYRMTDPRLAVPVDKTENGYRKVQHRMSVLRRAGELPYGWITDATRRGHHVSTFADGGEMVEAFAGMYRQSLWNDAPEHVEVWCESRSIAGVIEGVCNTLAVSLYPCGGFPSITFAWEAARNIRGVVDSRGKEGVFVVYVGDHDPAGVLIDESVGRELRAHLGGVPLEMKRVAVTPEQIEAMGLPTKPRKPGDRRRPDVAETVEAEALPASALRSMVRDEVEARLPAGALAATKAAEESEREGLRLFGSWMRQRGGARALADEERLTWQTRTPA